MIERFNEEHYEQTIKKIQLPFVTISREYGCPAKEIAAMLVQKINSNNLTTSNGQQWRIISKEILEEGSKELNVHPDKLSKFFKAEKKTAIDDILTALTEKYYHSDLKIKKTLTKIIQDFANKGNVVIVGRGGIGACCDFEKGFHIRLFAPMDWRANKIIEKGYCQTLEEARKLAKDIDIKRDNLVKFMSNNCIKESSFDITYNCSFFNKDEITESILYHLILKGLLKQKQI